MTVNDGQLRRLVGGGWLPRVGLLILIGVVAAPLWVRAEAHAVAPEAPEVEILSRQATSAFLRGVLNPGKEGEGGTYEFLYKASKTECEGGSHAPMSPGLSLGLEHEEVLEELVGLEPGTEYTLCLRAENTKGEPAVSPPVTFRTALPPETPETKPATEVTGASATLNGTLNPGAPGEAGTYEFLYRASATECEGAEGKSAPEPVGTTPGMEKEAVSVGLTELLPTTQYTFCLLARNQAGETAVGPPETFTTPAAAPTVSEQLASGVGSTEATLSAQIAPGGLPTTYHVDYGTSVPYPASTTEVSLPASPTAVGVQEHLTGLQPGTLYHVRVVATNSLGAVAGVDVTFTTAASGGPSTVALPDNRGYELVSTVENTEVYFPAADLPIGLDISGLPGGFRAAAGGDAITYLADPPSSGEGEGTGKTGNAAGNQYLAKRGQTGWYASDIEPLGEEESKTQYMAFSPDLAVAVAFTNNFAVKAEPQAPADCLTKGRRYGYFASYDAGGYHALPAPPAQCAAGGWTAGTSADHYHILLPGVEGALYDSTADGLHRVDLLPSGEPALSPNATFGGGMRQAGPHGDNNFSNDISDNGSRVFWTDLNTAVTAEDPAGTTRLFVRANDAATPSPIGVKGECTDPAGACTVQVDAVRGGSGSSGGGRFWTASNDGSKVFFTDCSRLTDRSTAVSGGGCGDSETATGNDLYEYDVNSGHLTDLTVDLNSGDALGADVQGVIGASKDGTYVYFVAHGVLTSGSNAEAKEPTAGQPNLYLAHNGTTTFVATLSGSDHGSAACSGNLACGDWVGDPATRTAEVAPAGHRVAFMSTLPLTGYDTRSYPEVFVYDADRGKIACASCDPSGAPPVPMVDETNDFSDPVKRGGFVTISNNSTFATRWINDGGTEVFFNTSQALVPQDTNGRLDVYEWESDGAGSCRQSAGCIKLLSTGISPNRAEFVDASATGSDAFFIARADLVPQAGGEVTKLYDARVDGGFPEISRACTGTGCQGVPPAPPTFATPSSATFSGTGNFLPRRGKSKTAAEIRAEKLAKALKVCRATHNTRKRVACKRRARKLYGAARSKARNPPVRPRRTAR
jgi:hypothetical protein